MSLEQAITENTAALKQLISTLQGVGKMEIGTSTIAKDAKSDPAAAVKAAATAAVKAATTATAKTAAAKPAEEAKVQEETSAPEVTYDMLKVKVLELAGKDRDAVLEVLSRFGVTTAKDLEPEQYAPALIDFERVLEGGLA